MKKNASIIIVATIMIFSSLVVGLEATGTNYNGPSLALPQQLSPPAYEVGNLYIYANGTTSNSTAIQQIGNQYNLQANVNGTLTDYRNNSILNGNGYTINGSFTYSLELWNLNNVTLENLNLTSEYVVLLSESSNSVKLENSQVNSTIGITNGAIYLKNSNYIWINSDKITGQGEYVIFSSSDMVGLYINNSTIYGSYSVYTTSNMVDFYMNHDSVTIQPYVGKGGVDVASTVSINVGIYNSTFTPTTLSGTSNLVTINIDTTSSLNTSISGNTFIGMTPVSISADYYENVSVTGNTFINSTQAIDIYYSANVVITDNSFINNSKSPLILEDSSNILVANNIVTNFQGSGQDVFDIEDSVNVQVSNNILSKNSTPMQNTGIYLYKNNQVITTGNAINNYQYGINMSTGQLYSVFANSITNSSYAINVSNSNIGSVYSNNVVNSTASLNLASARNAIVFSNNLNSTTTTLNVTGSTNITIYHNNFLGVSNASSLAQDTSLQFSEPLPVGGNYWSGYNGTGTGGIGSTQYNVTTNYTDLSPLLSPWNSYTVTFVAQGLTSGTMWSVNFGNSNLSSSTSSIVFSPEAAQHISVTYSVPAVAGYALVTSTGTVSLDGSSKVVTLSFSKIVPPAHYSLTISEAGLPAGMQWTTTFNGTSYNTTGTSITLLVQSGTYNITLVAPSGYTVTVPSNNVTVSNANQTFNVTFARASVATPVTFYAEMGAGVFFGAAAAAFGTMFVTGSGIFRKPEE